MADDKQITKRTLGRTLAQINDGQQEQPCTRDTPLMQVRDNKLGKHSKQGKSHQQPFHNQPEQEIKEKKDQSKT
jgi:hypothetical protein